MKILFPLEVFFPSQAGGPANSIYWIARSLKVNGFQPVIVASDKGLPSEVETDRWLENEVGAVIFVTTRNLRIPLKQTFVALRSLRDADLVQISSIFYPAGTIAGIAARLIGKKVLWSPRGELDPKALEFSKWRKQLFLYLVKTLVGTAATYHSTCDEETQYIRNAIGEEASIVQIPNFIELPELVDRHDAVPYFLYLGRLDRKKGIDNLLNALSESAKFRNSELTLKIAGTGIESYVLYLSELTARLDLGRKVEFIGQVNGVEKQELLANAYFTLMPSHTENFGNVVLESLAQNTPVLASTGTPWSSLVENKIGVWVDNDPPVLSEAIEGLIDIDPNEYAGMRSRSRDFVVRNYDIETNYDRWIDVYRGL